MTDTKTPSPETHLQGKSKPVGYVYDIDGPLPVFDKNAPTDDRWLVHAETPVAVYAASPAPQDHVETPDALELRYREGFEDGEKHAADELALAQSYRDTYKRILDELQERGLTAGTVAIIKERRRQIAAEGWTPKHDDDHTDGSLALAAGSYCESAARPKLLARKPGCAFAIPKLWPSSWSRDWWKPKSPREDLVRAGALILAEIERLDRKEETGHE